MYLIMLCSIYTQAASERASSSLSWCMVWGTRECPVYALCVCVHAHSKVIIIICTPPGLILAPRSRTLLAAYTQTHTEAYIFTARSAARSEPAVLLGCSAAADRDYPEHMFNITRGVCGCVCVCLVCHPIMVHALSTVYSIYTSKCLRMY